MVFTPSGAAPPDLATFAPACDNPLADGEQGYVSGEKCGKKG
jgi:hypothetical protein